MTIRRTVIGTCLATLAVAWIGSPVADATPSPTPDPTWVSNGRVWATVRVGNTIYLGGGFTELSPPTGGGVVLDPDSGVQNTSEPVVAGSVSAIAPTLSGGWYIGGSFTRVGGQYRYHLALIRPDGTLAGWNPKATGGPVLALAISPDGGTLYAGGTFTTVKNQARAGLAAFDTSTGSLLDWNPGADGAVNAIAIAGDGSRVFLGGAFTSIGGSTRLRIAAVDPAGAILPWNPGASATVNALAVSGTTVYVGGAFTTLGGQSRLRLGAVEAGGSLASWNPGADGPVNAIVVSSGTVYVGGAFATVAGSGRPRLAAVGTNGSLSSWNPGADAAVRAIAIGGTGSPVFVAGDFLHAGGRAVRRLAAIDTATGAADPTWAPNANRSAQAIAVSPDGAALYAGGSFTGMGGVLRSHLGAIDATSGVATGWDPSADGTVFALATDGSTVWAGGSFANVGGLARNRLGALSATSGAARPGFKAGANYRVHTLALTGGLLYVGGDFTRLGQQPRERLAAVDPSSGALDDWDPGADDLVRTLLASGDGHTIYVGGEFNHVAGGNDDYLSAIDAVTGGEVGAFSPGLPDFPLYPTFQLATDGPHLYAAMGGGGGGRLRSYDGDDGHLNWEDHADGDVQACAYLNGRVYAGGHFDELLTVKRGALAAVSAATGALDPWNPAANGAVWSLASGGSRLLVGGDFELISNTVRDSFATYTDV